MLHRGKLVAALAALLAACGGSGGGAPAAPAPPGAPTGVTAVAGVRSATVSWTPPASDGGSAITGYTVTASPGGATRTAVSTSAVFTGLLDATSYTFTVAATTAAGTGPASAASSPVRTPGLPGAPVGVAAVAGNGAAALSWSAPADDGGMPIIGYSVTISPATPTATIELAGLTATVSGLTNGTTYAFQVQATTLVGTGPLSTPSTGVAPATVPSQPLSVSAVAGIRSGTVSWSAPASDGGSAVTAYAVSITPSVPGATITVTGLSASITGLANATSYAFTVVASNAKGASLPSAPSALITTPDVPGAPTSLVAVAGDGSASLTWTAPASNGGRQLTGYTVLVSPAVPSAVFAVSGTSAQVTGLANGTTYAFRVFASNAVGDGPASSPSADVTPVPPGLLAPGPHTVAFSVEAPAAPATPVGGISLSLRLPVGVTIATSDAQTGEVASASLAPGSSIAQPSMLRGRWVSASREVHLLLASAPAAAWSGQFMRVSVEVQAGVMVTAGDLQQLNAPVPSLRAVGVDGLTRSSVDLTSQVLVSMGVDP